MLRDVRLAVRVLLKQPRFVGVAAVTLALGIGSVTAIFSAVNGVLLTPLPYPSPDRLVNLWSNAPGLGFDQFPLSPDLYYFFRTETRSFDDMTVFRRRDANLTEAGEPDVVPSAETSASYFSTLGIAPAVGQLYGAAHDRPGAPLTAVISHRLWQRRFGGATAVVGRVVQIDGEAATVLGVLPAWLDESESPDVWIPARFDAAQPPTGAFGWFVSARLKAGATREAAETEFVPLVRRLMDGQGLGPDYRAFLSNGRYRVMLHDAREDVVGDVRQPLWILFGTVGFVLLIACANVANLCLIRAEGRQREMAVRAALGATRRTLIRQQLLEALVLAAFGGLAGVLLAAVAVPALVSAAPPNLPRLGAIRLDGLVLLVAAAATAVSAVIFGIVPAFRYTRSGSLEALRHGGRGATVDKARHRGRKLLVVVQTALTLVLLVGSGLLLRSFSRMMDAKLGFEPHNVQTFRVVLPASSYPDRPRIVDFERRLLERLAALPGVEAAGAASVVPMSVGVEGTAFVIDGRPTPAGQLPPIIHYKFTAPGYLEAMGIRVLAGRAFAQADLADGRRDVLVNKAMADQNWPGADPIGRRLRPSGEDGDAWYTVVGVVESERHDGFRRPPPMIIYYPIGAPVDNEDARAMVYVLRGPTVTRDASAARAAVLALDPRLPVTVVRSMDEIVAQSIVPFTFTMLTLGVAAVMALLLGTVGLYGILSYAVTLRIREIGVRLALGAQPSRVMRAVVAEGLVVVAVGLAAGVAGAYGLTRFLGGLLYDTPALDALTFAAMSAALLAVALLASYLPARRAASISPLESLRSE